MKLNLPFKLFPAILCLIIGVYFWFSAPPSGLSVEGWKFLGLFIATVLAIILNAMPLGAIAMIAITLTAATCLTNKNPAGAINDALSGFSNSLIWLIAVSIMISRTLVKTGLGRRVGYFFISKFGQKTLGIAYSVVISETILAPITPSNTARGGGIINPIVKSISSAFDSTPEKGTQKKIGTYLSLVNYQTNPITSAMFITATAPNPLVVDLVAKATNSQIHLSWMTWALAMFLPAIVALFFMPLVIYLISPPQIKVTPNAQEFAKDELKKMGKMGKTEWIVLSIFALMLLMWAEFFSLFGLSINATTVAFIGLTLTLLTGVLTWNDVMAEKDAWNTATWFAALVMMATMLAKLGVVAWMSNHLQTYIGSLGFGPISTMLLFTVVFMYSHYLFASTTAHISAMFAAFYMAGLALGAPPMLYALSMAAAGNLMMSLTHYATGTAPVIFSSGYVSMPKWWLVGFIMSISNLIIFIVIGGIWWKVLGYY